MIQVTFGPGGVENVTTVAENAMEADLDPMTWALIRPKVWEIHRLLRKVSAEALSAWRAEENSALASSDGDAD